MIKLKNLVFEQQINEEVGVFKNKKADAYLKELTDLIGKPTYSSDKEHGWYDPTLPKQYGKYTMLTTKVDKVYIIDEAIPHSFPADHIDFVYTT